MGDDDRAGGRSRGAGAGAVHADAGLPAGLRRLRRQAQAGVRGRLKRSEEVAPMPSAHSDTFARDHLPPPELLPEFLFDLPELKLPSQLNCAAELLDVPIEKGHGERVCIRAPGITWSWRELQDRADRIAHVLVHDMGVVPGNRVLLRAPNNPMLAACWFGVVKAGAIVVATMPMLRGKEVKASIDLGGVAH